MLHRRPAELPQRVLQTLGQGGEALATEHDLGMFPSRIGESEVVDPMGQRFPGNGHAEIAGIEEIGEPLLARRMSLAEDHLPLFPVPGAPMPHAAFQRSPCRHQIPVGIAALHLFQHGDRLQARRAVQKRSEGSRGSFSAR
jgi:hypothetical protein